MMTCSLLLIESNLVYFTEKSNSRPTTKMRLCALFLGVMFKWRHMKLPIVSPIFYYDKSRIDDGSICKVLSYKILMLGWGRSQMMSQIKAFSLKFSNMTVKVKDFVYTINILNSIQPTVLH